ncbi:hypothetical protein B0H10DRAFT_2181829 [Mycena sp. CBHHK59/15]|nr:hypothetical protein B0H10DRAFT_2181829 [Mycena sp. CBHHK59/15]
MPPSHVNGKGPANNPSGGNQHRSKPLLQEYPQIPEIIQYYVNEGIQQAAMPQEFLDDRGITVGLWSIQRIIKDEQITTTQHSGLTEVEKGAAILAISSEDPLAWWGGRKIKERLAGKGIHIPREFINNFRGAVDWDATDMCKLGANNVHKKGLWSVGPNEEWCVDGHEKILQSMGIAVWGIINKYSRQELRLWQSPIRGLQMFPLLYICAQSIPLSVCAPAVTNCVGIPMQTTSDKGSEVGVLVALQRSLRQTFLPDLDIETLPPHRSVKSIAHITRECGWRPIWEKELANVLFNGVSLWLWAKITQQRLDQIMDENRCHKVRKQRNSLLPTGSRTGDFYKHLERWGGHDQLIPVDPLVIDDLIERHTLPGLLQFGTDEMVDLCKRLYRTVGSPAISAKNGWVVFSAMISQLVPN